jgi:opacity protein-like surface antigen
VKSSTSGSFDEVVKVKLGEASLVASWPASERVSLLGRIGGYYAKTQASRTQTGVSTHINQTNSGLTFGMGIQYFLVANLALRGEFQRYLKVGGGNLGDSDYQTFSAGLLWKF